MLRYNQHAECLSFKIIMISLSTMAQGLQDAIYSFAEKWNIIPGSEKRRNGLWYHLYVESKIWHKCIYLWDRNTDIENKLMIIKGEGAGEG